MGYDIRKFDIGQDAYFDMKGFIAPNSSRHQSRGLE